MGTLIELEVESWPDGMRHLREVLDARVNCKPPKVFVLEIGELVYGSIYTQRISSVESISTVTWTSEDDLYVPDGRVLQLLRVNTFVQSLPLKVHGIPVGASLRNFCLSRAKELGLSLVCAVTKTTDFPLDFNGSYANYVADQQLVSCDQPDRGLNFHLSKGATVVTVIPGWRPQDTANQGHGVLVQYNINDPEVALSLFQVRPRLSCLSCF